MAALWRRKWIVLLTILTALGVAIAANRLITPSYVAMATVRVSVTSGSIDYVLRESAYTDRLLNTYVSIAQSRALLDQVTQELQLSVPPKITVSAPANSELIHVSASHQDPQRAAQIANAVAAALAEQADAEAIADQPAQRALQVDLAAAQQALLEARLLYESLAANPSADPAALARARADLDLKQQDYTSLQSQFDRARIVAAMRTDAVTVVDPAVAPIEPASPNQLLNLALGLTVGIVGAAGLAFLFENLDDRLHTTRAIRRTVHAPILAHIPRVRRRSRVLHQAANPRIVEACRWLRTSLLYQGRHGPVRSVVITSSERGEGRTTIAANLAYVMAGANYRVLVVDADLRSPHLHLLFDRPNDTGLSQVLQGEASLDDALQETPITGVHLLASGPEPVRAPELLGSDRMQELLRELATQFDLILLDAPPLEQVADAAVLSGLTDGVILVVQQGRAREGAVAAAIGKLDAVQARLIGVVVNQASPHDAEDADAESYRSSTRPAIAVQAAVMPIATPNGLSRNPGRHAWDAPSESVGRVEE